MKRKVNINICMKLNIKYVRKMLGHELTTLSVNFIVIVLQRARNKSSPI